MIAIQMDIAVQGAKRYLSGWFIPGYKVSGIRGAKRINTQAASRGIFKNLFQIAINDIIVMIISPASPQP